MVGDELNMHPATPLIRIENLTLGYDRHPAVHHLSGDIAFDEQAVKDHVRGQLAGYKTPKAIYPTNTPLRASNGKADYATAKAIAKRLTVAS